MFDRKISGRLCWCRKQHRVVGVSFDVLLQILRTLEALATHVASMRLERNVDSDVAGNVISLDCFGVAISPGTGQAEVVCRFASNMCFAQMILKSTTHIKCAYVKILGLHEPLGTAGPLTGQFLVRSHFR
jgi:hypothetical protein